MARIDDAHSAARSTSRSRRRAQYLPIARARRHRRPPHGRARRHRRDDRLVLLPALRLAERVRRDPRPPAGAAATGSRRRSGSARVKQLYFPDTNVLITRFLTPDGRRRGPGLHAGPQRRAAPAPADPPRPLRARRDALPRRGRARASTTAATAHETVVHEHGVVFQLAAAVARARPRRSARRVGDDGVHGEFTLAPGESATFVLETVPGEPRPARATPRTRRARTSRRRSTYWRRWLSQSRYRGRWRETVHRSALTLKLLTYEPTGAIVAAPTTSLPEQIGGGRNWDYRYTWIRDAAFSLYALLRLGFTEEAAGVHGLADRALPRARRPASRARSRSCTGSTAAPSSPRRCSTTSRATAARRRSGSATAPPTSSSSTSTAS